MNIFVTFSCPEQSAIVLPDDHINKMAVEGCQMLAIVASAKWGHNYGQLFRTNGNPYKTEKGAFRNHPCTIWANSSIHNATWLLYHSLMICEEFGRRFGHEHGSYETLTKAHAIFPEGDISKTTPFVRAMPDELKFDKSIDTFTAYKRYIASKEWVKDNYIKLPHRKPEWV
jgi:hypothetical protein